MSAIQLIPQVPEPVREVISRAKKLYLFGHFEYSLFTVASHYAYAAVESAIFHRWNVNLPAKLHLEHRKKSLPTKSATVDRIGWNRIRAYCDSQGWSIFNLLVNGKPFPTSAAKIVERLREEGTINDWQLWRLKEVYLKLADLLSPSHWLICANGSRFD